MFARNMSSGIDTEKIEKAVKMILEAIGEDVTREGLIDTPKRVADMYGEMFEGLGCDGKEHLGVTFQSEAEGLVIEKDITFYSMCEHHLCPFFGHVHIAYLPKNRVVGLSKLARTVDVFAHRPQLQERLTAQIADAVCGSLDCNGVMVVVEAEHTCMTMRGVKKPGTKTLTMALRGQFDQDNALVARVLALIGKH